MFIYSIPNCPICPVTRMVHSAGDNAPSATSGKAQTRRVPWNDLVGSRSVLQKEGDRVSVPDPQRERTAHRKRCVVLYDAPFEIPRAADLGNDLSTSLHKRLGPVVDKLFVKLVEVVSHYSASHSVRLAEVLRKLHLGQ